jgi:hypothetical protein
LFLDPRNSGESSVKVVASSQARAIRVPATTLLDLLGKERLDHLDAIKLDVEGAEDIVLEPFFRDAPESLYPSLLILEDGTRQWETDLMGMLASKRYRIIAKTRMNIVLERG